MTDPVDCPYCGLTFEDNAEYVDVGFGGRGVQVTGNRCDRCGASEQGAYKSQGGPEVAFGWFPPSMRHFLPDGFGWVDDVIARVFAEGVRHGFKHRTGAPHDSLAPALTFAPDAVAADVPF